MINSTLMGDDIEQMSYIYSSSAGKPKTDGLRPCRCSRAKCRVRFGLWG